MPHVAGAEESAAHTGAGGVGPAVVAGKCGRSPAGDLADSAMRHRLAVLIHDHQVDIVQCLADTGEIVAAVGRCQIGHDADFRCAVAFVESTVEQVDTTLLDLGPQQCRG